MPCVIHRSIINHHQILRSSTASHLKAARALALRFHARQHLNRFQNILFAKQGRNLSHLLNINLFNANLHLLHSLAGRLRRSDNHFP